MIVSNYKNFNNKLEDRNIFEILKDIKSNKFESAINSIRFALHSGKVEQAAKLKSELLAFTTSGTFGKQRKKELLISYSQIINLDFDHIPNNELENLVAKINECQFTLASFISPRGEGLKVFIRINSNEEKHAFAYNQVAHFYKNFSGYDFDPKCKDITRLCFVSNDPNTYINENANVFEVLDELTTKKPQIKRKQTAVFSNEDLFEKCLHFTEQKERYHNGNRNNFIYQFACHANRNGAAEEDTLDYCITNFDLNEKEQKTSIQSAYKNQIADFAKFANFAKSAIYNNSKNEHVSSTVEKADTKDDDENYLKNSPVIPQSVYESLPPILYEGSMAFTDNRSRDTFFTGAMAILSGCLPNVSGEYGGRTVYPHLFAFILAPAASGKGALQSSKALADVYHNKTMQATNEAQRQYQKEIDSYKAQKNKPKKGINEEIEIPQEPDFKVIFIPANTSNSKIIQHLQWNDGKGIICETEADTLGMVFKNDWGSYSDLLRKAFHHEKISVSRKTNAEYIEVTNPQLAVALSGTPQQVFNIISSAEDGLFSRFLFYIFKTDTFWLDPSPKGNPINLTNYFNEQAIIVDKMVTFFENDTMVMHLTDEQWSKFNPIFERYLHEISTFVSDDAQSVVKRLGLILYRFCLVFTAIRKFSLNETSSELYCLNQDFENALLLIDVYLQHSIIMFNNLPKQAEQDDFKSVGNKKLFFNALPKRFTRGEAVEIAKNFNIAERTVGTFLKSCLCKYLQRPEYGVYEKVNQT